VGAKCAKHKDDPTPNSNAEWAKIFHKFTQFNNENISMALLIFGMFPASFYDEAISVELLASVAGSEQGKIISVKLGPLSSASKAEHKAASRKNSGRSFDLCVVAAYLRHSKSVEAADDRFSRNLNVALAKMLDNGSTVGNSINFAIKASISSILGAKNSDPLLLDLTNKLKTLNEASSVSFPVQNGHDVLFTTFSETQFLESKIVLASVTPISRIISSCAKNNIPQEKITFRISGSSQRS